MSYSRIATNITEKNIEIKAAKFNVEKSVSEATKSAAKQTKKILQLGDLVGLNGLFSATEQ